MVHGRGYRRGGGGWRTPTPSMAHAQGRGGRGTPPPSAARQMTRGRALPLPVMVPAGGGRTPPTGTERLQLKLVREICDARPPFSASLNGIQGASITEIKSDGIKTQEGETFDGVLLCKLDASQPLEVECTFLVVKYEAVAKGIFECAVSVPHKRIAKAFFFAYSETLDKYVVCFERVQPFPTGSNYKGIMYDLSNQTQKHLSPLWLWSVRENIEALEALHKVGYRHKMLDQVSSFVYAASSADKAASTEVDRKILKIFKGGPQSCSKGTACELSEAQQDRSLFMRFLEMYGASELMYYTSFKELVENSTSLEDILCHPFILKSAEERVSSISVSNEKLFHLGSYKLSLVNRKLQKSLKCQCSKVVNLTCRCWKTTVENNRAKFGNFIVDTASYQDDFFDLARFIRNYVEHQREANPHQHVDYDAVERLFCDLFDGIFGYLYTYACI